MSVGTLFGLIATILIVIIVLLYKRVDEQDKENQERAHKEALERKVKQKLLDQKLTSIIDGYKSSWKKYQDYETGRLVYLINQYVYRKKISSILNNPTEITKSQYKQMIDKQLEYELKNMKVNISDD